MSARGNGDGSHSSSSLPIDMTLLAMLPATGPSLPGADIDMTLLATGLPADTVQSTTEGVNEELDAGDSSGRDLSEFGLKTSLKVNPLCGSSAHWGL